MAPTLLIQAYKSAHTSIINRLSIEFASNLHRLCKGGSLEDHWYSQGDSRGRKYVYIHPTYRFALRLHLAGRHNPIRGGNRRECAQHRPHDVLTENPRCDASRERHPCGRLWLLQRFVAALFLGILNLTTTTRITCRLRNSHRWHCDLQASCPPVCEGQS